jgi:hypothetical protein
VLSAADHGTKYRAFCETDEGLRQCVTRQVNGEEDTPKAPRVAHAKNSVVLPRRCADRLTARGPRIRINDQWRICFRWRHDGPWDVEIVDYH